MIRRATRSRRSRSCSPASPKVTPLRVNISKLKESRVNKNILLSEHKSLEVLATPERRSCRNRKPRESLDYLAIVNSSGRLRNRHKSSPSGIALNNIITNERFTKVETATGSGRKLTIKCGDQRKSKLQGKEIVSLLDSDDDSLKVTQKKEPLQLRRSRRASVSCTTPTRMIISTVVLAQSRSSRRSVSEIKKPKFSCTSSDEEFEPLPKRIKSARKSLKQSSSSEESESENAAESKSSTKRTVAKSVKKAFKPSVESRSQPLPSNVDSLTEAQRRLHVSAVPSCLPCREEEFAEIIGYVESKLQEGTGGCYYISGVPGTGKTATVMEVIRYLNENKEDYPKFNFYAMNGMRLTSPEQAYVEMWFQLTKEKATPEHAMKLLQKRFETPAPKGVSTIFLVDELDMLCNRKQSVLYNLFDWPSQPNAKLIIITIANTMDLPERVMINRVSSRLGLTRQTFQPYTHTQLQTIVTSRIAGLEVFHEDAIQLVSRKVAGLSGDARRALDICRRATELAEADGIKKIGMMYITKAHQEMFSSPKILAIRNCSKYEQMLLKVMVSEFHRTGVEETTVSSIFREMQTCLRTEGLEILSLPGTIAMAARLSAARLLLAEHMKNGLETKLRLNVATEEINFALKSNEE